ncbi:hypothetical protein BB558_000945 [Smittium angustum]|nr:hypothetical protein BB558_000945 [Smittium angustum]
MKKQQASDEKTKPRNSAAKIRIQKDISELDLPSSISITFPNEEDLLKFEVVIKPDEGYYKNGSFHFRFSISENYPHDPPKVQCTQTIYHPNIDLEGKVCLNILREDWKPVLNLNSVLIGLQFLFLEPNPDDPLNKEAASELRSNLQSFKRKVTRSMGGEYMDNVYYTKVTV